MSNYILPGDRFDSMWETLACFGKHKLGKSCLYVSNLEKVDLDVLEEIVPYCKGCRRGNQWWILLGTRCFGGTMRQPINNQTNPIYDELLSFERRPTKADCLVYLKAKRGEMAVNSALNDFTLPTPFPRSVDPNDRDGQNEISVRTIVGLLLSEVVTSKGIRLRGFKFRTGLDFRHLRTVSNLVFENCDILDGVDLRNGDFGSIKFVGCRMSGVLAEFCRVQGNLLFDGCEIGETTPERVLGIRGALEHNMSLCRFDLRGAHVSGRVSLKGCKIFGANPRFLPDQDGRYFVRDLLSSISLNGSSVDESLAISDCHIVGEVSFKGVRIGEALSVRECRIERLDRPEGEFSQHSLFADAFRIGDQMHLEGITCSSEKGLRPIRLKYGKVGGALLIRNIKFSLDGKVALNAKENRIGGQLSIVGKGLRRIANGQYADDRTCTKSIELEGTSVGGDATIAGLNFREVKKLALNLRKFECGKDLSLERLSAKNQVILDEAILGGQLRMESVSIEIPCTDDTDSQEAAFSARELHAEEGVEIFGNSNFSGHVLFDHAVIGKNFRLYNAVFKRYRGANAFSARNVLVKGVFGVSFPLGGAVGEAPVTVTGGMELSNLTCSSLMFAKGTVIESPIDKPTALSLESCKIEDQFDFSNCNFINEEEVARVSLRNLSCHEFRADPERWSALETIEAAGFEYQKLELSPSVTKKRVKALLNALVGRNFDPKIYRVMSDALTRKGHHRLSAVVAKMKEKKRPVEGVFDFPRAFFNWLYGKFTGYGYSASRALVWLLGGVAVLTVVAQIAWSMGAIVPSQPVVLQSEQWKECVETQSKNPAACWLKTPGVGSHQGAFNPLIYSLDTIVPIVSLGHEDNWNADTTMPKQAFFSAEARGVKVEIRCGEVLRYLEILMIAFGWMLTASVATAFSRPRV